MQSQPGSTRTDQAKTYEDLLARVRHDGAFPTRERAEEAVLAVLAALGRQLTAQARASLAEGLPGEAALTLTAQITDPQALTGWAFVQDLAARTGTTPAVARWETGAVLAAVAALAGAETVTEVLDRLPSGYALLFGRAELLQAA